MKIETLINDVPTMRLGNYSTALIIFSLSNNNPIMLAYIAYNKTRIKCRHIFFSIG